MAIQFETEHGNTVFLPELPIMLTDPEQARQAIARDRAIRRSRLFPLIDATANFACSWLIAPQGCAPFALPRGPWIITIGDDLHFAWGPRAFPAESLDAAIKAADHGVMITSEPEPFPYRVAATVAVRDRKNALIIETRSNQKEAWQARIDAVREGVDLPFTYYMPLPTKGGA
jgi:hypothetical protein